MGKGPFKMKGSPMQRNFGIGSPMRDEKEEKEKELSVDAKLVEEMKKTDPKYIGTEEHPVWTTHESQKKSERETQDIGEKKGYRRITDEKGDFVYYMPKMTAEEKRIHESGQ